MKTRRETRVGALYHVIVSATRKERIFDSAPEIELFFMVLKKAKEKYDFAIEGFSLCGERFDLVLRPGEGESLSAIMRWIMSAFAMSHNRAKGITGHLWGGRFSSRIL